MSPRRCSPESSVRVGDTYLPVGTARCHGEVATVVKMQPDRVQGSQRLNRLGIDSLMAVQLRNRIIEDLEATLPVAVFLQRRTIRPPRDAHPHLDPHPGEHAGVGTRGWVGGS